MKLPQPFIRLPLRFDVERLQLEVSALPDSAWVSHPTGYAGNSAVRLISVNGGENDSMTGGAMQQTPYLEQCPYIQQILGSFGTVWSRSRLMKLAPGAQVPQHVDINYHWHQRVRVHIPVFTRPEVLFYCDDEAVHMGAGEAWIFDNWRVHKVDNASTQERVHLVADTTGSAAFWQFVANAQQVPRWVPYRPGGTTVQLLTERYNIYRVMPPSEIDELLRDLEDELAYPADAVAQLRFASFKGLLAAFRREWRQLWAVYADTEAGLAQYERMLQSMREQAQELAQGLSIRSNRQPAIDVLKARLFYAVSPDTAPLGAVSSPDTGERLSVRRSAKVASHFDRPIFIVAAPRSGSTLLYETLACTPQLWTVGGEAHWLVEGIPALRPGSPGIDSNRLDATHASPEIGEAIPQRIMGRLQDVAGRPWGEDDPLPFRFLEKTPKNALRIPFFERIFPNALYLHLWRDPRQNISSIMEAWKSGRWITYQVLPDWDGPWSLLLPPGWQSMRGKSLAEISAYQWEATNRIILNDLDQVPDNRRLTIRYDELTANPRGIVDRICRFADLKVDHSLLARVSSSLPLSKYTLTAPKDDKWRANADAIEPLLPRLGTLWEHLQSF